jgi:hypothetical protein
MSESRNPAAIETDVWTFRAELTAGQTDLTGFSIDATDGNIGKIDKATYETGSSWVIVDTGPWIFGKKVMLPAGVIDHVDIDTETVFVTCTKDEIKHSPEYNDEKGSDVDYRERLGGYYGGQR